MIKLGDSIKVKFPKNIKLLLTDPPYGQGIDLNSKRKVKLGHSLIAGDSSLQEALSLLDLVLANVTESMAMNSNAVIFCNRKFEVQFENVIRKYFKFTAKCTWVKQNENGLSHGLGNLSLPAPCSESFIFANRSGTRLKYRFNDVIFGRVTANNVVKGTHPTPKPFDMLKTLIEDLTEHGDLVADPFAGNGNTLWAAKLAGRRAYGVEINADYVDEYQNYESTRRYQLFGTEEFLDSKQESLL
jgi:DNA modification methylase